MYIFNMVQHLKTGDVVAPALTYTSVDDWKLKYHQEMAYAIGNTDFIGLSILVTDGSLNRVFSENWIRETETPAEPIAE